MSPSVYSAGILCSLVAVAAYINTLDCGLCFDDNPGIVKNQDLRPNVSWTNLLWDDFWGTPMGDKNSHKSYRPLCVATFRLNYLLHELQPMGYHLVNVLLHSAVCYLYVQLCGVVFSAVWPALIAGLLFAVHPIHTEAVAGLVGRTELLSALFFIAAFFAYRRSVLHHRGGWWLAVTLVFCLCSVLSKEQGITIVAVCVTYEFFILYKMNLNSGMKLLSSFFSEPHSRPKWFKELLKRASALGVFAVAFLMVRVRLMQGGPNIFNKNVNPALHLDAPYRQLNWLYLCFVNSWLLLNPFHLGADWRFDAVPLITSLVDLRNLLTIITFIAVTMLCMFAIKGDERRQKIVLVGLAMTLFPYIPASNLFFPVGFVVAERVLYLPSMGFCMLVGYGAWCLMQSVRNTGLKAIVAFFLLGLLALQAGRTVLRNLDWESNLSLYTSGARFNPANGVMLTNLGVEHGRLKNYSFAERLYRTSIKVAPTHSRGYGNLGGLLEALRRYDEAESAFLKAIEYGAADNTGGKVVETYAFLIEKVVLRNEKRLQDALDLVEKALKDYPTYAQLYSIKGTILLKMNRNEEALDLLQIAVQSNLNLPETHSGLGVAYMRMGQKAKAEASFRNVLHNIDANHDPTMVELGKLLHADRKLQEALKYLQHAVSLKPRNTEALFTLAKVHRDLKNYPKARELLQRVVQLVPSHKEALHELRQLS